METDEDDLPIEDFFDIDSDSDSSIEGSSFLDYQQTDSSDEVMQQYDRWMNAAKLFDKYSDLSEQQLRIVKTQEHGLGYRIQKKKRKQNLCQKIKRKIYITMTIPNSSPIAMLIALFIMVCIILSTVSFIIESFPTFQRKSPELRQVWFLTETFFVAVFTIEYVIRMLSCPYSKLKSFFTSVLNTIDLLSVLPYFLELILSTILGFSNDQLGLLQVLRVIRLARIFRIFRLGRYSTHFRIIIKSFKDSSQAMILLTFFLSIGLILFSSLIYYAEQTQSVYCSDNDSDPICDDDNLNQWIYTYASDDPGKISPYQSIPHSIWWCIVTMTTVGYGDTFPITPTGKLVASVTTLVGLLLLAFPVGVLGAKFRDSYIAESEEIMNRHFIKHHAELLMIRRLTLLKKKSVKFLKLVNDVNRTISETESLINEVILSIEEETDKFNSNAEGL